jgi:leucyl/phenylalanyl-tRNA--protein transferase
LNAYAHGVFPMAEDGEILWFEPRVRGMIPLDERFHVPRRLARRIRQRPFGITWDRDFEGVMRGCAEREETWIDETIVRSYLELHRLGCAHSVECHDADGLQGGLYGVALGRVFFGESMFSRRTDASKVALVEMVGRLRGCGFRLFDTQWLTPHLEQFGAFEVPRDEYLGMLADALEEGPPGSPLGG